MKANGDTIRTKWAVTLVVGSFAAIVLIATLGPTRTVVEQPTQIILPTPDATPVPGPTVTFTPAPEIRTVVIHEPGTSKNTIIIVSPKPYPSPYASPCDPTPAVGNCPPGRRVPSPPATPGP